MLPFPRRCLWSTFAAFSVAVLLVAAVAHAAPEAAESGTNKPLDAAQIQALLEELGAEQGGPDSEGEGKYPRLIEALTTLTEQKDWAAVEQVVERYADRVQQDAMASYVVARAFQVKGNAKEATRYAESALKLNPGDQLKHIAMGRELRNRGWTPWAKEEYRSSIKMGPPTHAFTLIAQYLLAESMHDLGDNLGAANVLDELTSSMETALRQGLDISDAVHGLKYTRARAHYFHAVHFKEKKDAKESVKQLLEGLDDDQYNAEILVELFHSDLDATQRDRVRRLIRESADICRRQMSELPDDDRPFNHFAWLVSNTEGDFQEALAASKKSLELYPESSHNMDTLGRCYYAVGDYENAVKVQRRAIELDPHCQRLRPQLRLFEEALAKQKAK